MKESDIKTREKFDKYIKNNNNTNENKDEFKFIKKAKKSRSKSKRKKKKINKTISFEKNDEIIKFNLYNDKKVGLDGKILNKLIKQSELKEKIKGITDKEEDFSSDEETINKGQLKCINDINKSLQIIEGSSLSDLFYISYLDYNVCLLNDEDNLSIIKKQILKIPEINDISVEDEK